MTQSPILPSSITCRQCGYDLSGTPVGGACPECGLPVADSLRPVMQPTQSSPLAVWSMVFGILGLACVPFLGIVAVVLYFSAREQIRTGTYTAGSETMATVGLVLGIIGSVLSLAMVAGRALDAMF